MLLGYVLAVLLQCLLESLHVHDLRRLIAHVWCATTLRGWRRRVFGSCVGDEDDMACLLLEYVESFDFKNL